MYSIKLSKPLEIQVIQNGVMRIKAYTPGTYLVPDEMISSHAKRALATGIAEKLASRKRGAPENKVRKDDGTETKTRSEGVAE